MQTIGFIICNSGDGSNHLEWFNHELTRAQLEEIEDFDTERYGSGDGVQFTKLHFPDEFSLQGWLANNGIQAITFEDWQKENSQLDY